MWMGSWAKELLGRMRDKKSTVEVDGREDFVHWHARLLRVGRRVSILVMCLYEGHSHG